MGMTDNELIELLRRMSPRLDMLDCENVLTAADCIEQLQAKLARAVEALRFLEIAATGAGVSHPQERKLLHETIYNPATKTMMTYKRCSSCGEWLNGEDKS